MIMGIQNLVKFCPFILKIWSKNLILESIKGRNSVANLRKTTIYFTNVDLESIKGRNSVANLRKTRSYFTNVDLVNVYKIWSYSVNSFSRY